MYYERLEGRILDRARNADPDNRDWNDAPLPWHCRALSPKMLSGATSYGCLDRHSVAYRIGMQSYEFRRGPVGQHGDQAGPHRRVSLEE